MRIELQTHPKIVRILSATKADKFRVIGGLHAVWSVFDAHCEDGILRGYTPETLDHIIGWSGFAEAMVMVGWLEFDGKETLKCPEFIEHNGKSAKRRAEDSKRKRQSRSCPQNVRDVSASGADKMRTREDKREDKYKPVLLPDWIPIDAWNGWVSARKKKPTARAIELAVKKLDGFRNRGIDVAAVLDASTLGGWTDLYEPKNAPQPKKLGGLAL